MRPARSRTCSRRRNGASPRRRINRRTKPQLRRSITTSLLHRKIQRRTHSRVLRPRQRRPHNTSPSSSRHPLPRRTSLRHPLPPHTFRQLPLRHNATLRPPIHPCTSLRLLLRCRTSRQLPPRRNAALRPLIHPCTSLQLLLRRRMSRQLPFRRHTSLLRLPSSTKLRPPLLLCTSHPRRRQHPPSRPLRRRRPTSPQHPRSHPQSRRRRATPAAPRSSVCGGRCRSWKRA